MWKRWPDEGALWRCTGGDQGIDGNVLAQIKQDNWASYELYDMAVELAEAQVAC